MTKRDRNIILGVAVLLILTALGYETKEFYAASEQEHQSYKYQPASKPRLGRSVPGRTAPDGYQPSCQNPRTQEDSDLCAQWAAVEQVGEANRLSGLNLKFAIASLWATFIATLLLIWNLIETRETARRELRAYVFFRVEVEKGLDKSGKLVVKWGLTNTGQTPAIRLKMTVNWCVNKPNPPESTFHSEILESASTGFLGGGSDSMMAPRTLTFTAQQAADVKSGKAEIYIFGCAAYEDVFGKKHSIQFRRHLHRKGGLRHFFMMPSGEDST